MARYTKSNSKIDPKKFLGKGGGDLAKRVGNNERKITLLKNILQAQKVDIGEKLKFGGGLEDSIQTITDSVTSISQTLLDQQELDKGQEDDDRIADQQKKRNLKEKLIEGGKGLGDGIKNQAQKAIAPIQGAFDKIKEWLIKLFAAKAIMELLKWFGDPKNQEKVSSIFRFIKDWWPSILTALLLFAGSMLGPGGIILAVSALVIGFIPKIANAIKSLFGFTKDTTRDAEKGEKEANKVQKDSGQGADDVTEAPEPGTQAPIGMNQGGQVPGSGNKDTVPAMLTPGEFVMSKDAVNQWGMDTLSGMNAAAGGKNTGSPLAGFSEGGPVMNKETDRLAKRIDPLITGEPEQHTGAKGALLGGLDALTGGLFDFDGKSGGGLLSKASDALGNMFGGKTDEEGDVDLREAIADLQDRFNYSIYDKKGTQPNEPASSKSGGGSGGAGLEKFISILTGVPFVGPKIADAGKDLISGIEGMIDVGVVKIKKELGIPATVGDTAGVDVPGTPPAPTTTVAYANAVSGGGGGPAPAAASAGNKVPSFSVGKYASPHKIKVLGISR
jgi:uncharacterized membrane protein